MSRDRVSAAIRTCSESLESLKESLELMKENEGDHILADVMYDASVKRFEVAFEYAWKMMKAAVEYEGVEAFGPRPAIQEAVRFGWIKHPDFWVKALDARNGSVHDYFGISRNAYIAIMQEFLSEAKEVISHLNTTVKSE